MTAEEYRDALGLASGYTPPNLPPNCRGCGKANPDFRHLMQCRVGGANQIRHNEYATVVANIVELAGYTPVALEVRVPHPPAPPGLPEPAEPLRTDITARGIFDPQGTTHFDVKYIDSGGDYVYERMTTQAERDRGSLDLSQIFAPPKPVDDICDLNDEHDITRPPAPTRAPKTKAKKKKPQTIPQGATQHTSILRVGDNS